MSTFTDHVADYLRLRRSLGFKLEREGKWLADLADLAAYVAAGGAVALARARTDIDYQHPPEHADMSQKERAIARVTPTTARPGRYQPPDTLLAFLEAL